MAFFVGFALWDLSNKLKNNEESSPLYVFIFSTFATLFFDRQFFYQLSLEKRNKTKQKNTMNKIRDYFNQAVDCTHAQWKIEEHETIEDSLLIFSAADNSQHKHPRLVNEIVKKVLLNNGIEVNSENNHESLLLNACLPLDDASAINDQILAKLNKLKAFEKIENLITPNSTASTVGRLKHMKGKKSEGASTKKMVKLTDEKKEEGILPPELVGKGKLITRKNSKIFISINENLTLDDLKAIPDRFARKHGQNGAKILMKGDAHPFWIKKCTTNKRIPLDRDGDVTILENGIEKTVPNYSPYKQIKK